MDVAYIQPIKLHNHFSAKIDNDDQAYTLSSHVVWIRNWNTVNEYENYLEYKQIHLTIIQMTHRFSGRAINNTTK